MHTTNIRRTPMKAVMLIAMQNHPDDYHADHELYWEECRLADLAESLGFDSLWAVEHHFDAYAMIPDVVQFLTYIDGSTSRIQLGTAVIVLHWHDPVPDAARRSSSTRVSAYRWRKLVDALSRRPRSWSRRSRMSAFHIRGNITRFR